MSRESCVWQSVDDITDADGEIEQSLGQFIGSHSSGGSHRSPICNLHFSICNLQSFGSVGGRGRDDRLAIRAFLAAARVGLHPVVLAFGAVGMRVLVGAAVADG